MSWVQIHVTGLSETTAPSDDELESLLDVRYDLSSNSDMLWAGAGTTLIKRDTDTNVCRGYAFLAFYSAEGAAMAIDKINNTQGDGTSWPLPSQLQAELSKPKTKQTKERSQGGDHSDIRLRSKRKAPVRKHPVIVNSDKTKTGLGNKTR